MDFSEKVIIYLVFLSLKITKQTLEPRKPSSFEYLPWTQQDWTIYRGEANPNIINVIENDEKYL